MKLMIASDIHGSAYYCQKMLERFDEEKADRLLLLGDLLYHGPRNELPRDYAPKKVIEMLNEWSEKILCVRGNCDAEVDQMVLKFPIMADYLVFVTNERSFYATHGHKFNEETLLPCVKDSILLCGHFHVPKIAEHEDYVYLNAGSVSIPKENSFHSYMIFENDKFVWKDIETSTVQMEYQIQL
ncbi:MAG: phosphodiesterase [Treponema sp.]|nr:phosphodiesterase [Treponema sp.]